MNNTLTAMWNNIFGKKKREEPVVIRKPKEGWYNPDFVKPNPGDKVKIDCGEMGEREAIYRNPIHLMPLDWQLTDCTHPMQNMNMYDGYVQGWKPIGNTIVNEDAICEIIESKHLSIQPNI